MAGFTLYGIVALFVAVIGVIVAVTSLDPDRKWIIGGLACLITAGLLIAIPLGIPVWTAGQPDIPSKWEWNLAVLFISLFAFAGGGILFSKRTIAPGLIGTGWWLSIYVSSIVWVVVAAYVLGSISIVARSDWAGETEEPYVDHLPLNNIAQLIDCESSTDWDVIAFDKNWGPLDVGDYTFTEAGTPQEHCEYELVFENEGARHFTFTYAQPVRGDLALANFWLPDAKGQQFQAAVVALDPDPNAPIFGPRLDESVAIIEEGGWSSVVLDVREQSDFANRPIAGQPFLLQLTISIVGDPIANTTIVSGFNDIALLENVGSPSIQYANDGLSTFISANSMTKDIGDFAWRPGKYTSNPQEATPEAVRVLVGNVAGTFVRYPVTLRSALDGNDYSIPVQMAGLERTLRAEERENLSTVIASFYIESDEDTLIKITPYMWLDDGSWTSGIGQFYPTNQWVTLVWNEAVDSTDYGEEFISEIIALREAYDIRDVGYIRLMHILYPDTVSQFGFEFKLKSDIPPVDGQTQGPEDYFEGTIYLGNVTFIP